VKDFFISYTSHDRIWAEWIAWNLEEEEFSVVIQAWDFVGNWVVKMNTAMQEAERTIAVLSPHYLEAMFTQSEWANAFRRDPTGEKDLLIPVRIAPVEPKGVLAQIVYVDLVGRNEGEALELLLKRIRGERGKPTVSPQFPGAHATERQAQRSITARPVYPDAQRVSAPAHKLDVEKITDFEVQKDRINDAIAVYEERIPSDERYDHEMMVDLVRRHLSTEFGPTWMLHFLVARYGARCVGMLICYEDIRRNFAFIAYLATRNPRMPGKNPRAVSWKLAESLLEERRRLGMSNPPRFLFEVDHPALTQDKKERRLRLGRLRVFDRLAPFSALHLRALDLPYMQPTLESPLTESRKQLLLCYAAPGLNATLPKSETIELLTWVYTELYGDDIFEERSTRAAYKKKIHELLDSIVQKLPEQIPLLRYRELEDR
jgi:hypothetical protein